MFKRFIIVFISLFLIFSMKVYADNSTKEIKVIKDLNLVVEYKDYDGSAKTASITDDAISVNGRVMINIDSLDLLNMEAEKLIFIVTYAKSLGYIVLDPGLETNKIGLFIDNKTYTLKDLDYNKIKDGTLMEPAIEYEDTAYIPIEVFDLMGLKATSEENKVYINVSGDLDVKTVVTGIDRKKEVLIAKRGDQEVRYKLIGVDVPDDDKTYYASMSKVVKALIGKQIEVKYDLSVTSIAYDVEGGYFYIYAYLPGDDISLNEQILNSGYAVYKDYNVGTELREVLVAASKQAQSDQLGIHKMASSKVYNIKSVNGKIVTITQGGSTYKVDFEDKELSSTIKQYISSSLITLGSKYIGKDIELKVKPTNNYDFVLYIITYLKEHK
jgi:endonuclease YncB( thermonuclease family)